MMKYLKISASALALSVFVVAPATMVVTADYAVAKSDNAGGNGNGGGNKGGNGNNGGGNKGGKSGDKAGGKGGDKKAKAGSRSKSNGSKGTTRRTVQQDLKSLSRNIKQNGIAGIFGKKQKSKSVTRASAPAKANANAARKADPLHPSNLGKMNGMINSSPNAKAAHIANGQYLKGTGPVSLAAALAVADYEFAMATDAFDKATETAELAAALDEANALLGTEPPTEEAVAEAQDFLNNPPEDATDEDIAAAESVVNDAADRQAAQDFVDNTEAPSEEDVAAAQETLDAGPPSEDDVIAAEEAALATYKGDLADEDEEAVLDAVRASLPDDGAIAAAVAKANEKAAEEETVDGDVSEEDDEDGTDSAMNDADEEIEIQG